MKRVLSLVALVVFGVSVNGQTPLLQQLQEVEENHSEYIPIWQYWQEHNTNSDSCSGLSKQKKHRFDALPDSGRLKMFQRWCYRSRNQRSEATQ
jgi:hypothetical protein